MADTGGSRSVDRRDLLKKAAVGSGVVAVAWSAPKIEGFGIVPNYASAQTIDCEASEPDTSCTGATFAGAPVLSATAEIVGANISDIHISVSWQNSAFVSLTIQWFCCEGGEGNVTTFIQDDAQRTSTGVFDGYLSLTNACGSPASGVVRVWIDDLDPDSTVGGAVVDTVAHWDGSVLTITEPAIRRTDLSDVCVPSATPVVST